ncbi:hypothetical protein BDV93DRAFT_605353 [Ceratobasidium sp. AG-I]|nr:hypothetical protein BDV93DRAFT_605353 [Ceratobasidium sp. AG-I]
MTSYYGSDVAYPHGRDGRQLFDLSEYDELIERDGVYGAHSLQALASEVFHNTTPKPSSNAFQGHVLGDLSISEIEDGRSSEAIMSTPPLSPSTTINSLHTDEQLESYCSRREESPVYSEDRELIRKGKQRVVPEPLEDPSSDGIAAQEEDWYGLDYAMERSRVEQSGGFSTCPPSAGESSTSDAAFISMFNGYIYPQDAEYWYEHWRKWHRALSRDERRRNRAASDAKHTRTYDHATYVQWEQTQRKKHMYQPSNKNVGSKPMSSSHHRYRASTCLF